MSSNETTTKLPNAVPGTKLKTTGVALFNDDRMMYELHFRVGNGRPTKKYFILKGDLPEAIERSKRHCIKMNYRFCGCYPFIVDLDLQESRMEDNLNLGSDNY